MWDLAILLIGLIQLNDLVEMRMECLGDSSEFSLAFVLLAEGKHFSSGLIVELKELGVGSKGVQDILADVKEE